ncbi:MAG: family 43 glycosylhydrolase [Chloroflexi bacterium]|nr:family 43 glycosylhydrolase [Chloroflexota bacterium]
MKPSLWIVQCLVLLGLVVAPVGPGLQAAVPHLADCSFLNPLVPAGADPSVVFHDGAYYMVQSSGTGMSIVRSETLTGLNPVNAVSVYQAPTGQPYSYDWWAPELKWIDGQWVVYVAATDAPGNNTLHRMFVLEADTDDPLGDWTMRGQVTDPDADVWAIDASVFEHDDQLYMIWSGWPEFDSGFPQNLYIAPMSDPFTISGPRVMIGEPDKLWERSVAPINEGPQAFIHEGELSIVYSADASWTRHYKLAILHLTGEDPLDPAAWTEIGPVFAQVPTSLTPIYGPGHNSDPIPSLDGTEWWFLYHAKTRSADGWDDRAIYLQEITWSDEGLPLLGDPIPSEFAQPIPSGEPCGLVATYAEPALTEAEPFLDTGAAWIATKGSFSVAARVRLFDLEGPDAFVSQEGGLTSNFILGYDGEAFTFSMYDMLGQKSVTAAAATPVAPDVWVHLIGIYDATQDLLTIYVDGEPQGQATFTEVWDALGHTIIGAARQRSRRADILSGGEVRDVQLFNGALTEAEIEAIASASPD